MHCKIQVRFDIGILPQTFGQVMALFDLVFVFGVKYKVNILFALNSFWRDAIITFEVCRIVYRYSKEVKFDLGNQPNNFGRIIALFY